ncbi:transposase [Geodermatophilus saharensis]|uniref:transposase n=1 Tax=Geodermatophilus saharensis TaxID=1137994 RepID=UPI003CCB756A
MIGRCWSSSGVEGGSLVVSEETPWAGRLQTWQQPGRRPRLGRVSKYSEEFRRQAAMLVVDGGRGVRDVARELDVNHETLRNWVGALKRERATSGGPVSGDERAQLARLRRRVAELELEKEILKKPRSSSPGRRGGEPERGLRLHRRGEDHQRRAPSLPGSSGSANGWPG